mmetsp:Transcript_70947/g.217437  ORF Transcript_70947/g.217437 Transcript_70947/m.217437 type:complete len:247 (-) Transcript_70947:1096-1836(-)
MQEVLVQLGHVQVHERIANAFHVRLRRPERVEGHLCGLALLRGAPAELVREELDAIQVRDAQLFQALLHEELLANCSVTVVLALVAVLGVRLHGVPGDHLQRAAEAWLGALGLLLWAIRLHVLDLLVLVAAVPFGHLPAPQVRDDVNSGAPAVALAVLPVIRLQAASCVNDEPVGARSDRVEAPLGAVPPAHGHRVDALPRRRLARAEVRRTAERALGNVNRPQALSQPPRDEDGIWVDFHDPVVP